MLTVIRTSGLLNVYSGLFWNIKIVTHHFALNICIHFRLHFHNPSFGLHMEEEPSTPAPPPALIPGQHQYTNPIESSGANDNYVSADLTSLPNNTIRRTRSICLFHIQIINLLVSQQFQSKHAEIIFPSPFAVPCGKLVFCLLHSCLCLQCFLCNVLC